MALYYNSHLKQYSRNLPSNLTDAENLLWSRLRRKQLCDVRFYRQKPIGHYIVDFYPPRKLLVVELDGGQHFEAENIEYDKKRDAYLARCNLKVLRFDNLQVLQFTDEVLEVILGFLKNED